VSARSLVEGGGPAEVEIDLGAHALDRGAHLAVRRALRGLAQGDRLAVRGSAPELAVHLRAFCRAEGHAWIPAEPGAPTAGVVVRGGAVDARRRTALPSGAADPAREGAVVEAPDPRWGLAPRGAAVEAGGPAFHFSLSSKSEVWADEAGRLYQQAAAAQWDPRSALRWDDAPSLPDEIEDAVVQIMTYLVENETAALLVPARFLAMVHPHFREVMQLLAIQAADEARHIEVFTRRALLRRGAPGLSTVAGQTSLKTLLDEPDFAIASFLLSVLGEGTFLSLLWFLHRHAPDALTRDIVRLAAQDEARHVAFGLAHLERHGRHDASLRPRLAAAVERRHQALRYTAGLDPEVEGALLLLAAGSHDLDALARGHDAVVALVREMDEDRKKRLERLGFRGAEAEALSALHTRNFM
jgi:hypothetical protein